MHLIRPWPPPQPPPHASGRQTAAASCSCCRARCFPCGCLPLGGREDEELWRHAWGTAGLSLFTQKQQAADATAAAAAAAAAGVLHGAAASWQHDTSHSPSAHLFTCNGQNVAEVDRVLCVAVGAGCLRRWGMQAASAQREGERSPPPAPVAAAVQKNCPGAPSHCRSALAASCGTQQPGPVGQGAHPAGADPCPAHLEDQGVLEDEVGDAAGQHINGGQQEAPQHNLQVNRSSLRDQ